MSLFVKENVHDGVNGAINVNDWNVRSINFADYFRQHYWFIFINFYKSQVQK